LHLVVRSVDFHGQRRFVAEKIYDVSPDIRLPAKAKPVHLIAAQIFPERALGHRHFGAKRSGLLHCVGVADFHLPPP
jgi:hypothetical protein